MYLTVATMLAMAIMVMGFGRLLKTGQGARLAVRWSFVGLTCATAAVLWCLWVDPRDLPYAWLGLLAAITLVQGVTGQQWRDGPPDLMLTPSALLARAALRASKVMPDPHRAATEAQLRAMGKGQEVIP